MVYAFPPASRIKADANAAGQLFERLEQQGRLTAAAVVDASRPEDAPLHNEFEWDDSVAAEEYRKEQARHIIRSIRIVSGENQEPKRIYFNIVQTSPVYKSTATILRSADDTALLLEKALNDLEAWQNRYKEVKELIGFMKEIDNIKRQHEAQFAVAASM